MCAFYQQCSKSIRPRSLQHKRLDARPALDASLDTRPALDAILDARPQLDASPLGASSTCATLVERTGRRPFRSEEASKVNGQGRWCRWMSKVVMEGNADFENGVGGSEGIYEVDGKVVRGPVRFPVCADTIRRVDFHGDVSRMLDIHSAVACHLSMSLRPVQGRLAPVYALDCISESTEVRVVDDALSEIEVCLLGAGWIRSSGPSDWPESVQFTSQARRYAAIVVGPAPRGFRLGLEIEQSP